MPIRLTAREADARETEIVRLVNSLAAEGPTRRDTLLAIRSHVDVLIAGEVKTPFDELTDERKS